MVKSIETRIEQLEKKSGVGLPRVVIHVTWVPGLDHDGRQLPRGKLTGVGSIKRKDGESERDVFERAKDAALAASNGNVILIDELDSRL